MSSEAQPRPVDIESEYQYGSFLSGAARWILHNQFAVPPIGIMDPSRPQETNFGIEGEMMFLLELKGDESIADIACGDGRFIRRLVQMGHKGKLTGINYPEGPFIHTDMDFAANPQVQFIESKASDLRLPNGLPIPDNSYDVVTLNFACYHMSDWEDALEEAYRILKPGGKFLLASRDPEHQFNLWDSAQLIAAHMERKLRRGKFTAADLLGVSATELAGATGISPRATRRTAKINAPESYYKRFDLEKARRAPERLFHYTNTSFRQTGYSRLHKNGWELYSSAAAYFYSSYTVSFFGQNHLVRSQGPEFEKSIKKIIRPRFRKEIKDKGYYREHIEQGFDIWEKPAA